MSSELFETVLVLSEDKNNISLEYFILKATNTFGVKIYKKESGAIIEEEAVESVFLNREDAEEFLLKASRMKVTPCTLINILDDYIGLHEDRLFG